MVITNEGKNNLYLNTLRTGDADLGF